MSERDTYSDSGTSPYDEPTGRFSAVDPDAHSTPAPDRDAFYDRYNKGRSEVRRVDDLDDIDPGELSTSPMPATAPDEPWRRMAATSSPETDIESAPTTRFAAAARPTATAYDDEPELPTTTAVPAATEAAKAPMVASRAVDDDDDYDEVPVGRGTLDLGLLVLRVAVGAIAMAHGFQKLFGWWNGPGLDGFQAFLTHSQNTSIGFHADAARPLAIIGALSESTGGLLLILGLATPLAASAVLGVMIIATTFKATASGGVWFFETGQAGPGIEYEILLGICAAVIILTGPGRISLDAPRKWSRRPAWGSALILVLAIAVAVAVWVVFNGSNPSDLL